MEPIVQRLVINAIRIWGLFNEIKTQFIIILILILMMDISTLMFQTYAIENMTPVTVDFFFFPFFLPITEIY